jgi:hypothetical protein
MHKSKGCCRDVVKVVKLETSHVASQIVSRDFSVPSVQSINTEFLITPLENSTGYFPSIDHGPPLSDQDVHLKNCVFRI